MEPSLVESSSQHFPPLREIAAGLEDHGHSVLSFFEDDGRRGAEVGEFGVEVERNEEFSFG